MDPLPPSLPNTGLPQPAPAGQVGLAILLAELTQALAKLPAGTQVPAVVTQILPQVPQPQPAAQPQTQPQPQPPLLQLSTPDGPAQIRVPAAVQIPVGTKLEIAIATAGPQPQWRLTAIDGKPVSPAPLPVAASSATAPRPLAAPAPSFDPATVKVDSAPRPAPPPGIPAILVKSTDPALPSGTTLLVRITNLVPPPTPETQAPQQAQQQPQAQEAEPSEPAAPPSPRPAAAPAAAAPAPTAAPASSTVAATQIPAPAAAPPAAAPPAAVTAPMPSAAPAATPIPLTPSAAPVPTAAPAPPSAVPVPTSAPAPAPVLVASPTPAPTPGATPSPAPAPAPAASAPIPPQAPAAPPAELGGEVLPNSDAGRPLVNTPVGLLALTVEPQSAPPAGARVTLAIIGKPVPLAAPFLPPPPDEPPDKALPRRLTELVEQLQGSGNEKQAEAVRQAIPAPGPKLAAQMLSVIAAAEPAQGLPRWLGEGLAAALGHSAPEAMAQLSRQWEAISQPVQGPDNGDWRSLLVPLMMSGQMNLIRLTTRNPRRGATPADREKGTRFLLDLDLSRLGPMQFDGLVKRQHKHFDLIIRTRDPLPAEMRRDIDGLFLNGLMNFGLRGSVVFQPDGRFLVTPRLTGDANGIIFA